MIIEARQGHGRCDMRVELGNKWTFISLMRDSDEAFIKRVLRDEFELPDSSLVEHFAK